MFQRTSTPESPYAAEIARRLDDAAETLRWCRKHLEERQTRDSLRLLKAELAGLTTALDAEMQGEPDRAREALARTRARLIYDPYDPYMPMGC